MSFYISLSGLKGAQADLSTISNNVANVGSTAFKKSKTIFGDIFAAAPMQTTNQVAGQGTRVQAIQQQFTQGTIETTDKVLDLAITGEGFFSVKAEDGTLSYTRNGAFSVDANRFVLDSTGSRMQVFPTDPDTGAVTSGMTTADLTDLQIPLTSPTDATIQLSSVGINDSGLVSAVYADGSTVALGQIAMATFPALEGLRQQGDGHWEETLASGDATFGVGNTGLFGAIRSGALERSNVDITEELVSLISAQRNFQANAKALDTATQVSQAILNIRS